MAGTLQKTTLLDFHNITSSWVPYYSRSQSGQTSESTYTLRVATWNVWENDKHIDIRHPCILDLLFTAQPAYHVIMLQEVTMELYELMLRNPHVRQHWLTTDLKEQFALCPNSYSTVILIDNILASEFSVSSAFMEYENSLLERGLNVLELSRNGHEIIRFATSHFESHPEDVRKRAEQFRIAAHVASSAGLMLSQDFDPTPELPYTATRYTVPAIVAGDSNIQSYEELALFTSAPFFFVDALLEARPLPVNPLHAHPTYGKTVVYRKSFSKPTSPKRVDYILTHGSEFKIRKGEHMAGTFGCVSLPKPEQPEGEEESDDDDDDDDDDLVWPSDHLGVFIGMKPMVHRARYFNLSRNLGIRTNGEKTVLLVDFRWLSC